MFAGKSQVEHRHASGIARSKIAWHTENIEREAEALQSEQDIHRSGEYGDFICSVQNRTAWLLARLGVPVVDDYPSIGTDLG